MKNYLCLKFAGNLKISEYGIYVEDESLEHKIREEMGCGDNIMQLELTIKPVPGIGMSIETEDDEYETV